VRGSGGLGGTVLGDSGSFAVGRRDSNRSIRLAASAAAVRLFGDPRRERTVELRHCGPVFFVTYG